MQTTTFVFLGSLLAALAVGLGAIGAHALEKQLTPEELETFHTAVDYLMIHALGLVLVGLFSLSRPSRLLDVAGGAMLLGILLFSGFLLAWLATGIKAFVFLVPIGGVAFIVGWLALAVGSCRCWQKT